MSRHVKNCSELFEIIGAIRCINSEKYYYFSLHLSCTLCYNLFVFFFQLGSIHGDDQTEYNPVAGRWEYDKCAHPFVGHVQPHERNGKLRTAFSPDNIHLNRRRSRHYDDSWNVQTFAE